MKDLIKQAVQYLCDGLKDMFNLEVSFDIMVSFLAACILLCIIFLAMGLLSYRHKYRKLRKDFLNNEIQAVQYRKNNGKYKKEIKRKSDLRNPKKNKSVTNTGNSSYQSNKNVTNIEED